MTRVLLRREASNAIFRSVQLTERELTIVQMLSRGEGCDSIAAKTGTTEQVIKNRASA